MPTATAAAPSATKTFQGISVPAESVNGPLFQKLTRRKRQPEISRAYAGLGQVDTYTILKSDIMTQIQLRFSGSLTVTPGTGTVATTAQWPYGLLKNDKLTANGQSNLIDASGPSLKVREFMNEVGLTDRGVSQSVSGSTVTQGTLSMASEHWGVGQSATAIGAGTYPVELVWTVPVAEDDRDMTGAIFCQTSEMDITLQCQWALATDLFALTGNGAVALSGTVTVTPEKFSIPYYNGQLVVPDLSLFHSLVETPNSALSNGENQVRLIGQGFGKQLLRIYGRIINDGAPLAVNATNYGAQSWVYGTNERPETYLDGQSIREQNEKWYGTDIAGVWGYFAHEFARRNAFRDSVDMGQTSDLRLSTTIQSGVTLSSAILQYTQETVFSSGN